jgi:putative FmdB family regulatory protein
MIYEYRCKNCEHIFEVMQKMSDPAPEACEKCGAKGVERIISSTSFALKGSGWYSSGYQKTNGGGSSQGSGGSN